MILRGVKKIFRYTKSLFASFFIRKIDEEEFTKIYRDTKEIYSQTKNSYDYEKFVMPKWKSNTDAIEKYFLNDFSIDFLRNEVIQNTMFIYTFSEWKNIQKRLISQSLSFRDAKNLLREYNIGKPLLNDWQYKTSGNSIHHLYHILKFFKEASVNIDEINTIVEVGGGYGNMARIFKTIHPQSTYVIVDIPIFSAIQSVYLKTILGKEVVVFLSNTGDKIEKGKVNLVPLNLASIYNIKEMVEDTDLFISTWALSESNQEMQNLIKELAYFNAQYLLLAYQKSDNDFGFAENIRNVRPEYTPFFNKETEYLRDNYYLFAKRSL